MQIFCLVYGCSSRSNWQTIKNFYRVSKNVVEKCKKLPGKWCKKSSSSSSWGRDEQSWVLPVCGDHFIKDNLWPPSMTLACSVLHRSQFVSLLCGSLCLYDWTTIWVLLGVSVCWSPYLFSQESHMEIKKILFAEWVLVNTGSST